MRYITNRSRWGPDDPLLDIVHAVTMIKLHWQMRISVGNVKTVYHQTNGDISLRNTSYATYYVLAMIRRWRRKS